jgi:ankyrin repeat protein
MNSGLVPGTTQAHIAVEKRDTAALRLMDPEILSKQDRDGETALHYAATNGDLEMCKIIIGLNPKIANITDSENKTALDWALAYNAEYNGTHQEVCDYLKTLQ